MLFQAAFLGIFLHYRGNCSSLPFCSQDKVTFPPCTKPEVSGCFQVVLVLRVQTGCLSCPVLCTGDDPSSASGTERRNLGFVTNTQLCPSVAIHGAFQAQGGKKEHNGSRGNHGIFNTFSFPVCALNNKFVAFL